MNTAAKVAAEKIKHPGRFCGHPGCLWRVTHRGAPETPCPKHPRDNRVRIHAALAAEGPVGGASASPEPSSVVPAGEVKS